MDKRAEEQNEVQNQFFRFSPAAIGDHVYNAVVETWQEEVKRALESDQFKEVAKNKKFKEWLTGSIFSNGNLAKACDQISNVATHTTFAIPPSLVLPEDSAMHNAFYKSDEDEDELKRRKKRYIKRIEEAKRRIALAQSEHKHAQDALKVLHKAAECAGISQSEMDSTRSERTISVEDEDDEEMNVKEETIPRQGYDDKENTPHTAKSIEEKFEMSLSMEE